MSLQKKDQNAILGKFGIGQLNPMQVAAHKAIRQKEEILLLSPTGTGKTLAFLLPLLEVLDSSIEGVQILILVPSRELAIQVEQVAREMGSGWKVNAVYGGRGLQKDKVDLKHPPTLLVGTPGRIADHLRRKTIDASTIQYLVLDEFDKSLEVGFEKEMKEIIRALPYIRKKILTSATQKVPIPDFLQIYEPYELNYLHYGNPKITIKTIVSPVPDKLDCLSQLLQYLGDKRGIIFCNFKDTIQFVSDALKAKGLEHICFYGGLEQQERERALIKFRNETYRILLATDLAARGIDVPALDFIIHYQLPLKEEEFIHRNGRTARMEKEGTVYLLKIKGRPLPDYIGEPNIEKLPESLPPPTSRKWETLFISGGRKDKISKGDIVGLFLKQGNLAKEELGFIELKQDCAFVSVARTQAQRIVEELNNSRLKKKKVRIRVLENGERKT